MQCMSAKFNLRRLKINHLIKPAVSAAFPMTKFQGACRGQLSTDNPISWLMVQGVDGKRDETHATDVDMATAE